MKPWWIINEAGQLRREVIHHMGRRCWNWDYKGRGTYLITIAAANRGAGIWGHVETIHPASGVKPTSANGMCSKPLAAATQAPPSVCAEPLAARFIPNALGEIIAAEWARLADAWPGIRLLASQVMEDHFHGVIATPSFMAKPLGAIIGSFKARASSAAGHSLWGKGYVDTILFDDEAIAKAIAYVVDNPRRLAMKRANPNLFKVLRDLEIAGVGHFSAIGNHTLLALPRIVQLQCSRRDFAYTRDRTGSILRDLPPRLKTVAFDEKRLAMLSEIEHGAAVVSPCVSEGERELARQAFAVGAPVITLQNKGFSPRYKPGGKLFESCANGRLLMLAPIAWSYLPGEKPMTRADALVMNRIAQLIAGSGAAEINYRGMQLTDVEHLVVQATSVIQPDLIPQPSA